MAQCSRLHDALSTYPGGAGKRNHEQSVGSAPIITVPNRVVVVNTTQDKLFQGFQRYASEADYRLSHVGTNDYDRRKDYRRE